MAANYSFDVVSDFDRQELINAVDQLRREIIQRYDLKDTNTTIEIEETELIVTSSSDMTLQAVEDILRQKATKRKLSLKIFAFQPPEASGGSKVIQRILLKKGLTQEMAKMISKKIRDELKKVTVSIQGDRIRVTGKNKDDLQNAISLLRKQEDDLDLPLQFENYR
ncbi:YajQ family cyclic di-GMP-binding protein [Prochlorococcus sp. MIT 1307]|uniref:YajQ family cyclic di-GMP-binding protein n=1 Tax=Prochlorococcus sp. MIT 1307 TaxID=3096219 RepID=UPI002A7528B1|nr:YajQ family cyclic di-GMP-binding protein [Prochlorococcus sp. MIT 1307]